MHPRPPNRIAQVSPVEKLHNIPFWGLSLRVFEDHAVSDNEPDQTAGYTRCASSMIRQKTTQGPTGHSRRADAAHAAAVKWRQSSACWAASPSWLPVGFVYENRSVGAVACTTLRAVRRGRETQRWVQAMLMSWLLLLLQNSSRWHGRRFGAMEQQAVEKCGGSACPRCVVRDAHRRFAGLLAL